MTGGLPEKKAPAQKHGKPKKLLVVLRCLKVGYLWVEQICFKMILELLELFWWRGEGSLVAPLTKIGNTASRESFKG